tara:strand:- start:98 stop:1501 length:1404 start_codon:yes stop_codon:yes gene_type:complete
MLEVIILNYKPISKILLITIGFLIVFGYYFYDNLKKHILDNWTHYRQHPAFLPFAGFIKRDDGESIGQATKKNFIKVLWNIVNKFLSILMIPIYPIIQLILKVFSFFTSILNGIRNQITVIRNFLFKLFEKMYIRLQNGVATIIFFFLKLRETMKRSYGLMTTLLYSIEHGYLFFESMMKSPVAKFGDIAEVAGWGLSTFTFGPFGTALWHSALCFDEKTKIKLDNGLTIKISDLKLGQKLKGNNEILAIIKKTKSRSIYRLGNILVKGDHIVRNNNNWVRVKDISESVMIPEYYGNIVCLITKKGTISIDGYEFKDYTDTHNPLINSTVRKMVNDRLNGGNESNIVGCDDLISGFSPDCNCLDQTQDVVKIGEGMLTVYKYKDLELSGNIIVFENNEWIRVADSHLSKCIGKNKKPFLNYITNNEMIRLSAKKDDEILIRDFVEVGDKKFNDILDDTVDKLIEIFD